MSDSPEKPRLPGPPATVIGSGPSGVEDRYHDIFFAAVETTRMPMIVTDPHQFDNPIIFVNNAFVRMTGYAREELVGRNCRFLQGEETDQDSVTEIRDAIAEKREMATEILNYRKDGSTFWNALFVSPVFNAAGEIVYFFGSQLDVSRRRDAEEALYQAQKMEALGQLTGGIAHDFNNLLQVVSGYTDVVQVLAQKGKAGPAIDVDRLSRAADALRGATDRASKLTHQLLAFSRKQRLEGRAINLNNLIQAMSEIAERTLGDHIEVGRRLGAGLWNCRVDPTQAEVALLNVMLNARDAMPSGGTITVATSNRKVSRAQAGSLAVKPGSYVSVSVADSGTGMPRDVLARATEPFFTTKEEGKGTGLGLAMVYGFVKQSGGTLEIVSEENEGTTVSLLFPATDQAEIVEAVPSRRSSDRPGTETILIVDDRPDVAETAKMILSDFGYEIMVAHGSDEALAILDRETPIHLLFTDLIMPGGMDGVMLAREARDRQPKIRILLNTGYAEASIERNEVGGSEFEIIMKPYRRLELVRRVRRVLDGPTGVG